MHGRLLPSPAFQRMEGRYPDIPRIELFRTGFARWRAIESAAHEAGKIAFDRLDAPVEDRETKAEYLEVALHSRTGEKQKR